MTENHNHIKLDIKMTEKIEKNVEFIHYSKDRKNANIIGYGTKITRIDGKVFAIIDAKVYEIINDGERYNQINI